MLQKKIFFATLKNKKNCKYFLIFSTRLNMFFWLLGNIKINNDTKKKIKLNISFFLVETNRKIYSANFTGDGWMSKRFLQSLLTLRFSIEKLDSIKFFSQLIFSLDQVAFDYLIQYLIFKRKKKPWYGMVYKEIF